MKYLQIAIILTAIMIAVEANAQDLEITGYYENQFFPQELNDKVIFQDYNKLRLDLSVLIGENVSFNADYIYRIFHGAAEFNFFDFVPEGVVLSYAQSQQSPVDSLRPDFDFRLEDENFLDNAYVSIYFGHLSLRAGKQQLPWGTGYTWNPTDIFNEKNTLDPTYEKVGVNAFKLEVPFKSEGMATAVLSPGDEWKTSIKALKVKEHAKGFDYSACFAEKLREGFDYFLDSEFSEKRRLLGGDFSGQLLGLGVWAEGAYNSMQDSEDFGQYLLGADYTLESGLYIIGEYYRNELGKTNKEQYDFNDWMKLLGAEGENLGRHYLFLGERYPIAELWNWSNYVILNLNDKSGVVFPWLDYSLSDNAEVTFVGYLPFGEKESEFGEFGAGGFARIRVYF